MIKPGMFIADRYEIIDKVGSGGMADVYKARCHKLNRFVAVKVLKAEFSNDTTFVAKFRGEAQSAAGLSHPNIVNVYDVGEDNGLYFIVMELIEGITLKNFIERKGRLDIREAIGISIQIAQGMEAAHENHIIHRDIKPQNIIISKEGKVKVADFGIAKATTSNTLTSTAMGSVHYISPEQARGGYSDERSDIYSLGITIYEMVSGIVPFEGDNAVSIALLHIQGEARTLGELIPGVPVSIDRIVQKCMQKKPERRYSSVAELIADLKHAIMEPNVDFVIIPDDNMINSSPTIALSSEDLDAIRSGVAGGYDDQMMSDGYNMSPYGDQYQQNQGYNDDMMNNQQYGYNQQNEYGQQDNYNQEEFYDDLNDPEEEKVDPKVEKFAVVAAVGCAVIIFIILLVLILNVTGVIGGKDKTKVTTTEAPDATSTAAATALPTGDLLSVPDFTNRTVDKAKTLAGESFVIVEREEASEDIPEGYIIRQEPEEGEQVEPGTMVYVYVSSGTDTVELIDVAKMNKDAAAEKLNLAFPDIQIEYVMEASDTVDKDFVTRTEPEAKSQVSATMNSITVYVSSGKEVINATVPQLLGKTLSEASKTLSSNNLVVGSYSEEYNDEYPAGQICHQYTSDGMLIPEGSSISFVISKGKKVSTYTYNINVTVASSNNPFDKPSASTDGDALTSGTITVKLNQGNTTIDTKKIESNYESFASSGLNYSFEYTTDTNTLTKSNFAVEFVLNNKILSLSPSITVSSPTEN